MKLRADKGSGSVFKARRRWYWRYGKDRKKILGPGGFSTREEAIASLEIATGRRYVASDREDSDRYQNGFVYVVNWQDRFKIGSTFNLHSRINALNSHSPVHLSLYAAYEVSRPYRLERQIHAVLSRYRYKGEWFMLDQEALDIFWTQMNEKERLGNAIRLKFYEDSKRLEGTIGATIGPTHS